MTVRQLWLLRHAKSDWSQTQSDFERPLSPRGQRQIALLTEWMQTNGCKPQQIVSSPAVRAISTARYVAEHLSVPLIETPEIYEAELDTLLAIIQQLDNALSDVMLVGHNPGLSMLVGYLAGWQNVKSFEYDGEILKPASLAQLQTEADWPAFTQNGLRCLSVTHGKKLEKQAR